MGKNKDNQARDRVLSAGSIRAVRPKPGNVVPLNATAKG